jgi:hypothetical protein
MNTRSRRIGIGAVLLIANGAACYGGSDSSSQSPPSPAEQASAAPTAPSSPAAPSSPPTSNDTKPAMSPPAAPAESPILAARVLDLQQALRIAALKLTGDLPTMDEILAVVDRRSYEAQIEAYLADVRFARRMQVYFRNMMKMGGRIQVLDDQNNAVTVDLDTAPTFAAELVVEDRPMTELFTAERETCPALDGPSGVFTKGSCEVAAGGVAEAPTSGVLTDPGAMAQFYSNMSFRRVRWLQETFACGRFPAEFSQKPVPKGNGEYVSPWPFDSISGGVGNPLAPINFLDTSAVICANCHTTMNHIAPLLAYYDRQGLLRSAVQVHTPVPGAPTTKLSDWLPVEGRTFAWRFDRPVTGIAGLGQAMAADPAVARCQVARAWNWAMSKLDIVTDQAQVPDATIAPLVAAFAANQYRLKPVIRLIFTHEDFVRF